MTGKDLHAAGTHAATRFRDPLAMTSSSFDRRVSEEVTAAVSPIIRDRIAADVAKLLDTKVPVHDQYW
ncbi:MAG: hypothetical protein ABI112_17930, partial [Terracoccus sp.]